MSRHPTVTGNPPEIQLVPESDECTSIRTNLNILANALNPIDDEEWRESNIVMRCYQVVKCPVELLFRLTIPVVDMSQPRDNWCQYLVLIQCIAGET